MAKRYQAMKAEQKEGAEGYALIFSIAGFFCFPPLCLVGAFMGRRGGAARIFGFIGAALWAIALLVVLSGAFGVGDPAPSPDAEPPPFYESPPPQR